MDNNDKLKSKKEYYFRQYYNQPDVIRKRREIIEELNKTKKEIIDNPVYLSAIQYGDMPHNPNVNVNSILDRIIKTDDKIENIDNKILKQMQLLEKEMTIFDNIDNMLKEFTDNQSKIFECIYKEKMRITEVAYTVCLTERAVLYIKREILKKANFIQED